MKLYFITGNKDKFREVKLLIPFIEQLDIDLPEIQDIDPKVIIKTKVMEAIKHHKGQFIVEDTSFYLDCLNGLPGPFIKWFLKTVKNDGLFKIAEKFKNNKAVAKTIIGYANNSKEIYFFEGSISGEIVSPRGNLGFGWNSIFQPDGFTKTFAEMNQDEKNSLSMRTIALNKLKESFPDLFEI